MSHSRTNASETILCDPCLFDDSKAEATGFCWICVEYLCPSCIKEHGRVKMTRTHKVQRDNIPENADALKEIKAMVTCPNHADMDVTHHCKNHDVYVCALCRVDTHKNCENIHEIAKEKQSERLFSDVQGLLATTANALKETRKGKKENITSLYQNQEQVFKERQILMQQLLDESNNDTKTITESLVKEIEKDVEELDVIELSKTKYEHILDAAPRAGNDNQVNIVQHIMVEKVKSLGEKVFCLQRKGLVTLQLSKSFNISKFKPIGEVDVIRNAESIVASDDTLKRAVEISSDAVTDLAEDHSARDKNNHKITDTKADVRISKLERNISADKMLHHVRGAGEKCECSIQGLVILQNGQIVLIDYTNLKIKLFANDFEFLSALRLPGRPVRICTIGPNTVAVSFEIVKRINRYKLVGCSLVYEGGFNIRLYNRGITYDGKNILAIMVHQGFSEGTITYEDEIEVDILNVLTGHVLDTITDFKIINSNRSLTLKNPMAIHVNDSNEIVIAETNRILCFSLVKDPVTGKTVAHEQRYLVIGKEIPKHNIENIVSDKDALYVISRSGRVLQISNTDYNNKRLLNVSLDEGLSIAVDDNRILVGCDNDDDIHVFEFE
ncbi:uncharacterized protein LOC123530388 [Mercenaria mercenaria]|uniref:uncharacterized protein LOC123530388 n=1 Tax=Mercenaria mercenaria TaxID=6596 RepID=UPI00234F70E6|nr:uncharacterized protein LOC123530388 [Mercenaria mercenaria]